jgi:hypothetical protein
MPRKKRNKLARREFLKVGLGTSVAAAAGISEVPAALAQETPTIDRHAFFLAVGETLIPSSESSPGFGALESHGITAELMASLSSITNRDMEMFQHASEQLFGTTFLELSDKERETYLRGILQSDPKVADADTLQKLQSMLRLIRSRVMILFYQNFPEHRVQRDAEGKFMARSGDTHLIFNPNTPELKTGWDTTGFGGPLSWEQEEERRRKFEPLWEAYEKELHG